MVKIIYTILKKGVLDENPILVLMIGLCPVLAVSTTAINSLGMGLATLFVLVCSNTIISSVKRFVPHQLRIPIFIIVISTFVTITDYIIWAYFPILHKSLGVFIPLIVVNCVILGRAEMFASRNSVFYSFIDGIGMGIGFTIVITLIGIIREILGFGRIFGSAKFLSHPMMLMIFPPGGFLTIGFLMVILNWIKKSRS